MYALIALLLVILIGAGGGYWAIKKIRAKQNQEFRYEGKLTLLEEGLDPIVFKKAVLSGSTLDDTIKKHDLLTRWGMTDVAAAKERITSKFSVKVEGLEVTLGYRDKDKILAKEILETLMKSFYAKRKTS